MKLDTVPESGRYGNFGGRYVPETLIPALDELEEKYLELKDDPGFRSKLEGYNSDYGGRPSPLYFARGLTELGGGGRIYLKREDLIHGGAHKFNNVMGQALLAKEMGKERIICETGAGQHGVATALAGAVLSLDTEVYMGAVDARRQETNLSRMELLGSEVHVVENGDRRLRAAINEALRDWSANITDTYYLLGSVVGPHPYPMIVRDFQKVIGEEIKEQILAKEGCLPDHLVACVGGGSNAMGTFYPFSGDTDVELIGVEAGGNEEGSGASLGEGSPGVLHGAKSYLLQDKWGQIEETESIAAGLDYPGVGPEHALYKEIGRAKYISVSDQEAVEAFRTLSKVEGILPALESAHAVSGALRLAKDTSPDEVIVVTLSGRGDKDIETVRSYGRNE